MKKINIVYAVRNLYDANRDIAFENSKWKNNFSIRDKKKQRACSIVTMNIENRF